jgi:hypothetical protein
VTPELVALLVAAVAGAGVALLLDRRAAGTLVAGEALLLGIAACAAILLTLSVIGVLWSRSSFGAAMAVVIVASWAAAAYSLRARIAPATFPRPAVGAFLLYALTILLVAGYARFATAGPVWEFDFIGDWGFKARTFFVAGRIDWSFLEHPPHYDVHPDYPPLLPLGFDLFAVVRGSWDDTTMGLLSIVFAGALLLILHRLALEETSSRLAAAFVTAAMVPFACSPWIGIAEGPFVAYATAAILLLRRGSVAPGAVMLGLAAATKNEGLTLVGAVAVALLVDRRRRDVPRLWPAVAVALPWLVLRSIHGLRTDLTTGDVSSRVIAHLRDPRPLLMALLQHGAGKPLLWIALAAGLAVTFRLLLREERFALAALLLQFLCYIGAYLVTPHAVDWHVQWSWERLVSHLSPVLTYVVLVRLLTKRPLVPML